MGQKRTFKSVVLLILLGFIWGSGYSLAKIAITNGVSAIGYGFWQALGPALLLTVICLLKERRPLFLVRHWSYFLISGFLGIALPNTNMYFISQHLPAGLLAVLVNTVPLFVYPLALLFKEEIIDGWRLVAILLSVIGITMIIGISTQGIHLTQTLLALISPLSFASCSIFIKRYQPQNMSTLEAASGMLIAASLFLLPLMVSQHAFYPLWGSLDLTRKVVLLEILLSSAGYLIFFLLLKLAGPVFYSLTGAIVALTGLFWGYCIFAEVPSLSQSLAITMIISAVILLSWRQAIIFNLKEDS